MKNKMALRKNILIKLMLPVLWVLFVLYPNPGRLAASVYRLKNPPLAPVQVAQMAVDLQDWEPHEIEQFVYGAMPYRFDWEVYNMPWYFPTLDEALLRGSGDCKARYILFASLMEEMGLPYYKNISLTHIWVGYEGKTETTLESRDESFLIKDHSGRARFNLPRPDLKSSLSSFIHGFWKVMPLDKKLMLLSGFPVIFFTGYVQQRQSEQNKIKF
jgi:hypothetical protein